MFQVPLATSSTGILPGEFWEAVMLYHNRPHLINCKLIAASQALFCKINFKSKGIGHVNELFTRAAILYEVRKLKEIKKEEITQTFIKNILDCYDKSMTLQNTSEENFKEEANGVFVSVRILLAKHKKCEKTIEVVTLDKNQNSAQFIAVFEKETFLSAPPFKYEIQLTSSSNLRINLSNFEDADTCHAEWLADKLFTKLIKWVETLNEERDAIKSLSLVSIDDYCLLYGNLKEKYGDKLVKEWPKLTTTNPQKYIFEDIAIASYLICLWKKYSNTTGKFVDCGCGNGLLVYILNQEGYPGYGIDIRKRPTWKIYPKDVDLRVGTVTPSSIFTDCTWIIGNHSDELTPWIPVIALNSSPKTNFFVLPCCPYDFSGQKYMRTNTNVSQYSDYMNYIKNVCDKCGFHSEIDKLRIPSTKRTCLVGISKNLDDENFTKLKEEVTGFVNSRLSVKFTPRSDVEKVRNCTQLDKQLINKLIICCVSNLLEENNFIMKDTGQMWNSGGSLTLCELSKKIPKEDLKELKKECGGLQTLLRNHRYLFEIKEGRARIRKPLKLSETDKYKDKVCWFKKNHPDSCLHSDEVCAYQH